MTGQVPAGNVLIDGIGVGDIGNIVLRDRKLLSEDGIFVVVVTISRRLNKILSGPEIVSRGFVYMKASEELVKESSNIVREVVEDNLHTKDFDWAKLKQEIRDSLSRYLFEKDEAQTGHFTDHHGSIQLSEEELMPVCRKGNETDRC